MTVYLDSVFALNFAVNWLLLRAAARLGAAAVRPRRIAAAAALGAAYAVAVYLPGCGVLAGWAGKRHCGPWPSACGGRRCGSRRCSAG